MQPVPAPKIVVGEHTITIEHNGKQRPLDPETFAAMKTRENAGFSSIAPAPDTHTYKIEETVSGATALGGTITTATFPEEIIAAKARKFRESDFQELPDSHADDYFTGGAIKALKDEGELEGYLIVWGDATQRDKQGEFFTPDTELRLDYYQTRPILFHHGLASADSIKIGEIYDLKVDHYGVKAKGRLFLNHDNPTVRRFARFAWEETKANKMFWSSGSIAHLVEVTQNGQITKWPLVEGSLTPTPAEPYRTKVDAIKEAIKSILPSPDDETAAPVESATKEERPAESASVMTKANSTYRKRKGKKMMDQATIDALLEKGLSAEQVLAVIGTIGEGYAAEAPEDPIMAEEEEMDDEEEDPFRSETETPPPPPANGKASGGKQDAFLKAVAAMQAETQKLRNQVKAMQSAPATEIVGGRNSNDTGSKLPVTRKRSKWANLSWQDMIFVKTLLDGAHRAGHNGERWVAEDPVDFARELADKIEHEDKYRFEASAIKSVQAIKAVKADELNYSTLASFGDEFVPDLWRSQLWETPRLDNPVFREMQVIEMPSNPYTLPVESTDPTIYAVSETADENQLGINDSNAAIPDTQVGSGNTTLTAGKLAARIQISAELVEDSIIPVAQHWRFKAVRKMEDARDFVILSADATTGTTNINNSGGSISATNKALYGGGDGILHLPLVDNTANAVDMGGIAPTLSKIRDARKKLDTEIMADFGNLMYFCDPLTSVTLASLDEALNFQINGDQSTFNTGMVGRIDNIPVYVTSQMSLALSTGFVSSTAASNTLGRLLLVHKTSWYVGFRRNISVNLAFEPAFDAWTLVVSMRMALARRSTDVASLLYNIAV